MNFYSYIDLPRAEARIHEKKSNYLKAILENHQNRSTINRRRAADLPQSGACQIDRWPVQKKKIFPCTQKIFSLPFLSYRPFYEVSKLTYVNTISNDWRLLEAWKWLQKMPVTYYTFNRHPTCHSSCQDDPVIQDSKV